MAKTSKIVYVTQAQYDSLINNGSVTIYGVTYTYDANNTYLVREEGLEGTSVQSTGVTSGKVLTANGSGGASWQTAGGGSGDVTASGTLSVGAVMVGLGGKLITSLNGSNGKILGWNGGAVWRDPPKVYVHNLIIEAQDESQNLYFFTDHVYSTQSTALVTDTNSFVEYVKKTADQIIESPEATIYGKSIPVVISNPGKIDIQAGMINDVAMIGLTKSELRINSAQKITWSQISSGVITTLTATDNISEV